MDDMWAVGIHVRCRVIEFRKIRAKCAYQSDW